MGSVSRGMGPRLGARWLSGYTKPFYCLVPATLLKRYHPCLQKSICAHTPTYRFIILALVLKQWQYWQCARDRRTTRCTFNLATFILWSISGNEVVNNRKKTTHTHTCMCVCVCHPVKPYQGLKFPIIRAMAVLTVSCMLGFLGCRSFHLEGWYHHQVSLVKELNHELILMCSLECEY